MRTGKIFSQKMPVEPTVRTAPPRSLTLFSILAVSALMGALFGVLCRGFVGADVSEALEKAEQTYFDIRIHGSLAKIMLGALAGTGFYLVAAFALGFSALAQPFELLLPFFKGLGSGVLLAQIYGTSPGEFEISKFLAVFPSCLVSLIIIILASREAMYLSGRLFGICVKIGVIAEMGERVKLYGARFLALAAVMAVEAAIEPLLARLL